MRWNALGVLALTTFLALVPSLSAQGSSLLIGTGSASNGWRPQLQVNGVLEDEAFQEALESGLPLRFRFRVELWEKAFVDRLVGTEAFEMALVRDALEGSYELTQGRSTLRVQRLQDVERLLLINSQPELRPERRGRYYYLAVLEIETLSLSDLEELRRWIRGEARPAVQGRTPVGRAVGRGLQRAFVRMIGLPSRRYETRSGTFVVEQT